MVTLHCESRGNNIASVDTPGVMLVRDALQPLCASLHDVFRESAASSAAFRAERGLTDDTYNSMGADVTRALAHKALTVRDDLGAWKVGGRHNLRGQVLLTCGMMRIRFLHDPQHEVPAPGRNARRRAYYRNAPLGQTTAFDAESSNLIAVWRVTDQELHTVSFRVVRPIGDTARRYGLSTPVDLNFILPDLSEDLSTLEFEQVDEGLLIDLPETDEDTGDAASGDVR